MLRLALFVCVLHLVRSQNPGIVDIIRGKDLEKNVGDSVDLYCSARNIQHYYLAWNKEKAANRVLLSTNGLKTIPEDRYEAQMENTSNAMVTSHLKIKDIKSEDAGTYLCSIAIDANNEVTMRANLMVRSPPVIFSNATTEVNTILNNATKLECYTGGYPIPEVVWTRENSQPLPNGETFYRGNVLKIENVLKEHAGLYYCSADNKVGNSVKKNYVLRVQYAPIVKATSLRIGQAPGFEANLECRVSSVPEAQIKWYKDNMEITNRSPHYSLTQSAIENWTNISILKILITEPKLYGTYACAAVNPLGKADVEIQFYKTDEQVCASPVCGSGQNIFSFLNLKLSLVAFAILMLNWQM